MDNTIVLTAEAISPLPPGPRPLAGLAWGAAAVLAFSLSLPMTRLAVRDIDPVVVGLGRAVIAAGLALLWLRAVRAPRPARSDWGRLGLVALGVVAGFPLLTAFALRLIPSAHGAVVTGLLPVATAVMAVLRAGERPSRGFWLAAGLGLVAVLGFALSRSGTGDAGGFGRGDGLMLLAVALCGLGYAEGGALARRLGGPQVICWALVLALPVLVPVVGLRLAATGWPRAGAAAWGGFAYVTGISMFLGFFAWYRGLALGGVARVAQVQLAQPVLTLAWSVLLLGETVSRVTALAAALVLASVGLVQVTRVRR